MTKLFHFTEAEEARMYFHMKAAARFILSYGTDKSQKQYSQNIKDKEAYIGAPISRSQRCRGTRLLLSILNEHRMAPEELALRCNRSKSTIYEILNGRKIISEPMARVLAQLFGMDAEAFLDQTIDG